MRCPTIADLAPPPPGKTGWPWTIESPQLPDTMSDGKPWPRISIVTPSYNQGQFIEETIRSVLLQGYPNLEYIVIDGASTDDSIHTIKKYGCWLKYWVSENDRGQPHAINKGFERSSGEIFQWLNSDDLFCPNALNCVGAHWKENAILAGGVCNFSEDCANEIVIMSNKLELTAFIGDKGCNGVFQQPGTFLPLKLLRNSLGSALVREDFQYIFDWYLLIVTLALTKNNVVYTDQVLSRFRLHESSKTVSSQEKFDAERNAVMPLLAADNVVHLMDRPQRKYLTRVLLQHELTQTIRSKETKASKLLRSGHLLTMHPSLLWDRFYWGAIRRILVAGEARG